MQTTAESKKTEKNGKAKPKAKAPSKPSSVENPVRFVRDTCEKMKGAKRREVIAALVAKGVNKWTAATQYQLFHNPPKAKAKKS